jgi:hypothetical protein
MHLTAYFDETARRIEMVADFVVSHRFDHRECHALLTKIVQRVFNKVAAESAPARIRHDGEVRNPPLAGLAVETCADVSKNLVALSRNKDPGGIRAHIVIDIARFPPAPIPFMDNPNLFLDALVERQTLKGFDGNSLQLRQVVGLVKSNLNAHGGSLAGPVLFGTSCRNDVEERRYALAIRTRCVKLLPWRSNTGS